MLAGLVAQLSLLGANCELSASLEGRCCCSFSVLIEKSKTKQKSHSCQAKQAEGEQIYVVRYIAYKVRKKNLAIICVAAIPWQKFLIDRREAALK